MEEHPIIQYYQSKEEPVKSCLLALRDIILDLDVEIRHEWKYRMPFFTYKKRMFCYLWTDKKDGSPYIGIADGQQLDHPILEKGDRKRMSILKIDCQKDLPLKELHQILNMALEIIKEKK